MIVKKVHKVIQFNQEACLKACIDMNTKLKRDAKNDFQEEQKMIFKKISLN